MNAVKKTACALAVLATTSTAVMAEGSVNVKVIGTITPTACKPILAGGGTIDYGVIPPASLNKDTLNQLNNKQLDFAITCDAPAKVSLTAINGRPKTAAGTTENDLSGPVPNGISNSNGSSVVGLGLDGNKKIGGYNLAISDVLADGNKVDYIYSHDKQKWYAEPSGKSAMFDSRYQVSAWAKPGTLTPIAFTTLAGKLNVQAYLNKASELDLTKPVKLDGLTTLELVYL
ncbi:DUF1120 domain-containing protein [Serratia marcescens]|nr:DUF1120 domain-containing protein [Serratia marcescens]